ncbi:hypothetical protein K1719_014652 [Acacia pycnantha]|nr:hypothetical protein K1719_043222 [Acacia pycnantha]KAI9114424.1 hypothetical protein K1719_014652 [Acacia pycnantha]
MGLNVFFSVSIVNRGPDTELLVANPVELSGKGRPRVFYDVTFALKAIGICIVNQGPDTELLVANPVELSGKGRPRVFYDVTFALKAIGICIFSAEIGGHLASERQWEVYRFLLDENSEFQ